MLITVVRGDADSCRSTGAWLAGGYRDAVQVCADGIHKARRDSEDCWRGAAADAFRARTRTGGTQADDLAADAVHVGRALQDYADSLSAANTRMAQAAQAASGGGLWIGQSVIGDPGPAPLAPDPTVTPITLAQQQAWVATAQVSAEHEAKIQAYREAGELAADAREILYEAQERLLAVLADILQKAPLHAFDALAGMVTGYGAWAAKRAKLLDDAHLAGRMASNPNLSRRGAIWARLIERDKLAAAEKALRRSDTPMARAINRIPPPVRRLLAAQADELVPDRATGLLARGSRAVLGKVPVVGGVVTAVGIGADMAGGKPTGKAIFSGVAGFAGGIAGAAVVASGPVGLTVAAGVVAGIGVGYAADWAWDHGPDVAEAAWEASWDKGGEVFDAGQEFVDDLF